MRIDFNNMDPLHYSEGATVSASLLYALSACLSILSAFLLIQIVREITSRQEQSNTHSGDSWDELEANLDGGAFGASIRG